jgi:hypothetical protein
MTMIEIVCTETHEVDYDEDAGQVRAATAGMTGQAKRRAEVPPDHGDAYSVIWENGAWGFYTADQLAVIGRATGDRPLSSYRETSIPVASMVRVLNHVYGALSSGSDRELVNDLVKQLERCGDAVLTIPAAPANGAERSGDDHWSGVLEKVTSPQGGRSSGRAR